MRWLYENYLVVVFPNDRTLSVWRQITYIIEERTVFAKFKRFVDMRLVEVNSKSNPEFSPSALVYFEWRLVQFYQRLRERFIDDKLNLRNVMHGKGRSQVAAPLVCLAIS